MRPFIASNHTSHGMSLDDNLDKFVEEADVLEELRRANAELSRQLLKQRIGKQELVDAVYRAAKDASSGLSIKPVPAPPREPRKRESETAIAVLSDWQLAKITASYSSDICEQRIHKYADKVVKLAGIQRADHPVREIHVNLLGDLVEGEMIFPGQSHLIDASLYRQVVVDGPRILTDFLRRMASEFERVTVTGVIGNHGALGGRARREYHPETNADAMLMEISRLLTADEKRIIWAPNSTARERHWYAVDTVGDFGFLLFHGDQVKGGFAGFPWYGFAKKVQGWRMGAVKEPFHYALSGHFHTPVRMQVGPIILWGNGSTESDNTYAAEMLAAQGQPSQWLLFCNQRRGVSAEYCVWLDEKL